MQYCVSGSASNLITLIYPDLQDMKSKKYSFIFYIDAARHIVTLSWFPVCSVCDETVSAYAQRAKKSIPRMLSML